MHQCHCDVSKRKEFTIYLQLVPAHRQNCACKKAAKLIIVNIESAAPVLLKKIRFSLTSEVLLWVKVGVTLVTDSDFLSWAALYRHLVL